MLVLFACVCGSQSNTAPQRPQPAPALGPFLLGKGKTRRLGRVLSSVQFFGLLAAITLGRSCRASSPEIVDRSVRQFSGRCQMMC
jgi:hypothetical protein